MKDKNFTTEAQRHREKPRKRTRTARYRFAILRLGHRGDREHRGDSAGKLEVMASAAQFLSRSVLGFLRVYCVNGGREVVDAVADYKRAALSIATGANRMRDKNFTTEAQRHREKPKKRTRTARYRFAILRLGHRGDREHGGDSAGKLEVMASAAQFLSRSVLGFLRVYCVNSGREVVEAVADGKRAALSIAAGGTA